MGADFTPALAAPRTACIEQVVGDLLQLAPWPPGAAHPRAAVLAALQQQATEEDDGVLDLGDGASIRTSVIDE